MRTNMTTNRSLPWIVLALALASGTAVASAPEDGAMADRMSGDPQNESMMQTNGSMMEDHDEDAMMDDKMDGEGGDDNPLPAFATGAALVAFLGASWLGRRRRS